MTVIVGVANESGHWMAGDRATSDSKYIEPTVEPKIHERGQYLVGFSGNVGIGQNVVWNFDFPATETYEEMFTVLQVALNRFIDESGVIRGELTGEDGALLMILSHGFVWVYNAQDGQLLPYQETAIGSGGAVALGSLHTSRTWSNQERRVKTAAEIACTLVLTCRGPVDTLYMGA